MKTMVPIRFSEPLLKWLRAEAKKLDLSIAEFVRRVLDEKRLG